jgi:hypothetical protein
MLVIHISLANPTSQLDSVVRRKPLILNVRLAVHGLLLVNNIAISGDQEVPESQLTPLSVDGSDDLAVPNKCNARTAREGIPVFLWTREFPQFISADDLS